MVKRLSTMRETCVGSLGREDPLAKEMTTHSSILGWKIPWMEQPGSLHSMGSQRVGHDLETSLSLFIVYLNRWLSNIWLKCENSAMKVLSDTQISRRGNGSIGIQGPAQSTASTRGKGSFPPKAVLWAALNSAVWSLVPSAGQMRALQAYRVCNGSKEANCPCRGILQLLAKVMLMTCLSAFSRLPQALCIAVVMGGIGNVKEPVFLMPFSCF